MRKQMKIWIKKLRFIIHLSIKATAIIQQSLLKLTAETYATLATISNTQNMKFFGLKNCALLFIYESYYFHALRFFFDTF